MGWREGLNLGIEYRWGSGDPTNIRNHAAELAALGPDVILTSGAATLGPLLQATRSEPIVFVNVTDPVDAGFVDSLSQPGGNATGFIQIRIQSERLELLKELAPGVKRVGVIRDANLTSGIGQFAVNSVRGAAGRSGCPSDQCQRRERDARCRRFLQLPEWRPLYVTDGGLISYGYDVIE